MAEIQSLDAEVFTLPLAIVLIPIAVSVVCAVLGVMLVFRGLHLRGDDLKQNGVLAFILFAIAVVAGGFFAPQMSRDRIVVTPEAISFTKGFWFDPVTLNIAYRDVNFVRKWSRRHITGDPQHWEVHFLDGRVEDVPLGDIGKNNSERIEHLAKAYGVRFRSGASE